MIRSKRILLISIQLIFCYPTYFKHIYFHCNVIIIKKCVRTNARLYRDHQLLQLTFICNDKTVSAMMCLISLICGYIDFDIRFLNVTHFAIVLRISDTFYQSHNIFFATTYSHRYVRVVV